VNLSTGNDAYGVVRFMDLVGLGIVFVGVMLTQ
jgi:hypothetical protein